MCVCAVSYTHLDVYKRQLLHTEDQGDGFHGADRIRAKIVVAGHCSGAGQQFSISWLSWLYVVCFPYKQWRGE